MLRATLNESIPIQVQVSDGSEALYAQAKVYDSVGGLEDTINLSHIAGGLYGSERTFITEGYYTVVYKLYTDSGYLSAATEYDIEAEMIEANSDKTNIVRLLGLTHDNCVWDDHVYDSDGNLLTARLRHYDSKANADVAGAIGLLNTWETAATYLNERLNTYSVTRTT